LTPSHAETAPEHAAAASSPRGFARSWRSFTQLLERREGATSLAICRIVVGVTLVHDIVTMALSDTWRAVWVDLKYGGMLQAEPGPIPGLSSGTPAQTSLVMGIALVGGVLTALGLFTRLGLVLAWLGTRTLSLGNPVGGAASDYVCFNLMLPLIFSGSGRALSLDARLWPGSSEIPAWPRYLLVGQMVLMYWSAGLQKISSGWIPGGSLDALWYILQWTHWQLRPMQWVAPYYRVTQLATLVAWSFENSAPLLLLAFWFRYTRGRPGRIRALFNRCDYRSIYVTVGVFMHLGIWATLEVGEFFGYCMAYFACCFTPREWDRALARLLPSRAARTR
jgi:hypothetical protein